VLAKSVTLSVAV